MQKIKLKPINITKQVRRQIKETTWEKQNLREGFSETYKPLISQFKPLVSQFVKPEDDKTKNIFTQNQEMLKNQLALTEGIKANKKAITDGFSQFERLADMRELPGVEAIEEDEEDEAQPQPQASPQAPITKFNVGELDKYLNNKEAQDILENNGYENLPSYYFDKDVSEISSLINNVNSDLEDIGKDIRNSALISPKHGYYIAKAISKNPQSKTKENIKKYNVLSVYSSNLSLLLYYKEKSGSGIFYNNPKELLHRLELLAGSLAAGNNGVLPEYIQIAHLLRDLGILSNKQLNTLLRKVI